MGAMLHWMEALLAACEMWRALEEDEYLNAVIMQYNAFVNQFNQIISESALTTPFLGLMRQQPLRCFEAPREFLLRLFNLAQQFRCPARSDGGEISAVAGGFTTDNMSEISLIIMGAIIANILTPAVKYLWQRAARYGRRHYLWRDSTQQIIRKRRYWRKTSNATKSTHRFIAALASNMLDIEYIEWREAINKNNTKLYRKSAFTKRWERHSQENIDDCLVNPSYNQFLELKMDEDTAKLSAENKPMDDAFRKWVQRDRRRA